MSSRRARLDARAEQRAEYLEAAKVWHRHLIHVLGGKCVKCPNADELPLTIEHVNGRDWSLRKYRMDVRIKRYWQEYKDGVPLMVLCQPCNSAGGYYWRMADIPKKDSWTPNSRAS